MVCGANMCPGLAGRTAPGALCPLSWLGSVLVLVVIN